tara:strand:+ start:1562 stop:2143 length:582 start_codon:yes stop_codon:yes gene_type:complete
MNKTVSQITKEFYRIWRRTIPGLTPVWFHPLLGWNEEEKIAKFFTKDSWRQKQDEGVAHLEKPLNLWAHAHTISVQDEVITITRDEDNNVSQHTYALDSFNTICVKNLDEARKIENNDGLLGGLFVVDYSTKKVYRLVVKINNKVRLERVLNPYATRLPWFVADLYPAEKQKLENAFDGTLNTTKDRPEENGY